MADVLRAPFPWFGGKRLVADLVWKRLGDVDSYNEPFAGSLAVLLGRPHEPKVETVNDLDCYLANFWRALQHDPEGVAKHCDWPVNEADLHARHRWLVEQGRAIAERVMREPEFYDVKIAGWWVWGQCLWIGSGWCQKPEWTGRVNAGRRARGVHAQRTAATRSENPSEQRKRPHLMTDKGVTRRWQGGGQGGGSGVHAPTLTRQMPRIAAEGGSISGVTASTYHQKLPGIGRQGGSMRGALSDGVRSDGLYDYLRELAARLRRVRVCCGDWKRVLTPSVTTYVGLTGVFLDPPYKHDLRERCYAEDHDISHEVREWAIANGDNPEMRIALCGYEGEHDMPATWECVAWKAHGGYSRSERGVANRERERIWFSKYCLKADLPLFMETA
jgi:DNA adenine methylase